MHKTGLLLLLILGKGVSAQPRGASVWFTAQLPVGFSTKWQWQNDFTIRSNGMTTGMYQRFFRTGARYQVSEDWGVAGGIAFFSTLAAGSNKGDDEFGREFRFWEDITYQRLLKGNVSFQNRLRVEERFLHATDLKPAYQIQNMNYRISFLKPVSAKWNMQLSEEFFEQRINKKFLYNQNRIQGAGIYNVTKSLQVQAAYIWILRKTFSQHVVRKMFMAYGKHNHAGE
jgi:hypothetical protein